MTTEKGDEAKGQGAEETSQPGGVRPRRRRTSRAKVQEEAPAVAAADAAAGETKPKPARKRRTTRATARPKAAEPSSDEAEATKKAAPARRRRRTTRAVSADDSPAPIVVEEPPARAADLTRPPPRLLAKLRAEVGPVMMREFGYTSAMQIPRLSKVVLNIGLGEALENARAMENAQADLVRISGQRPVITRAKKSIAGFKIREGMAIGVSVALRGRRMYEFMDRLMNSSLPRIRDFQGVSRESFDGRGNYALGIREQVIFPEIDYNSIDKIRGMQVVIGTTARTDSEGLRMLELLGMPFTRVQEAARVA